MIKVNKIKKKKNMIYKPYNIIDKIYIKEENELKTLSVIKHLDRNIQLKLKVDLYIVFEHELWNALHQGLKKLKN